MNTALFVTMLLLAGVAAAAPSASAWHQCPDDNPCHGPEDFPDVPDLPYDPCTHLLLGPILERLRLC